MCLHLIPPQTSGISIACKEGSYLPRFAYDANKNHVTEKHLFPSFIHLLRCFMIYCIPIPTFFLISFPPTFWLDTSIECGGVLQGDSGVIQSPGYPNGYAHHLYCSWTIKAPLGRRVSLQFEDLDLERPRGSECPFDKLLVSENKSLVG